MGHGGIKQNEDELQQAVEVTDWQADEKVWSAEKAGISSSSLAKLTKDENVTTEVLSKICQELECDVADIMEFVPDPAPETSDGTSEGEKMPSV